MCRELSLRWSIEEGLLKPSCGALGGLLCVCGTARVDGGSPNPGSQETPAWDRGCVSRQTAAGPVRSPRLRGVVAGGGVQIEGAGLLHQHPEVSLPIELAAIPGVQPPITQQRLGGLGLAVVAEADVLAADEQLPIPGDPQLDPQHGS